MSSKFFSEPRIMVVGRHGTAGHNVDWRMLKYDRKFSRSLLESLSRPSDARGLVGEGKEQASILGRKLRDFRPFPRYPFVCVSNASLFVSPMRRTKESAMLLEVPGATREDWQVIPELRERGERSEEDLLEHYLSAKSFEELDAEGRYLETPRELDVRAGIAQDRIYEQTPSGKPYVIVMTHAGTMRHIIRRNEELSFADVRRMQDDPTTKLTNCCAVVYTNVYDGHAYPGWCRRMFIDPLSEERTDRGFRLLAPFAALEAERELTSVPPDLFLMS